MWREVTGWAHLWSCKYSLGRFRSCRKRSAILFFPTPWGEVRRTEVEPLSTQWHTHCTRCCYWRACVQAHLVAHQQEVFAQGIVLQHVLQDVQMLKCSKRHTQLKDPHGQLINFEIMMQEFVVQLLGSITSTTGALLSGSSVQRIGYTYVHCMFVCISTVQYIDSRRALCAEYPPWCVSGPAHQRCHTSWFS